MNNAIEENCEVQKNTTKYKLPRKKRGKLPKNQEEMSNLLGNIRNANKNNNGM